MSKCSLPRMRAVIVPGGPTLVEIVPNLAGFGPSSVEICAETRVGGARGKTAKLHAARMQNNSSLPKRSFARAQEKECERPAGRSPWRRCRLSRPWEEMPGFGVQGYRLTPIADLALYQHTRDQVPDDVPIFDISDASDHPPPPREEELTQFGGPLASSDPMGGRQNLILGSNSAQMRSISAHIKSDTGHIWPMSVEVVQHMATFGPTSIASNPLGRIR